MGKRSGTMRRVACAALVVGGALPILTAGGVVLADGRGAARERPDGRDLAKIELGRRLFFDPAASAFGRTSCASCHDPSHGFSDPLRISRDEQGPTPRHSQGLLDLAEAPGGFHWDGEFATLRDVVTSRLGTPAEIQGVAMAGLRTSLRSAIDEGATLDARRVTLALPRAMTSSGPYGSSVTPSGEPPAVTGSPAPASVSARLERDGLYGAAFVRAFGTRDVDTARIAEAMEAYLLSLRSTESPFDRYMAGDAAALSPAAERGFELFAGKAGCAGCHSVPVPGRSRAFSDFAYHNTGVAFVDAAKDERGTRAVDPAPQTRDGARRRPSASGRGLDALLDGGIDAGRERVSLRPGHQSGFKTPNLRDVGKRAPYMHDGRFATLEEVVRYYDGGGTPNAHLDPKIRRLGLTDAEVADLVAFLESLNGDERPGLAALPGDRVDEVALRIVDLEGRPLRQFSFHVRPAGDHFRGSEALPAPFEVTTDGNGYARFPFPASTHVALDAPGHELGEGRFLPDTTERVTLMATPLDTVSVVVHRGGVVKKLPSELTADRAPAGPPGARARVGSVSLRRVRSLRGDGVLYTAPVRELAALGGAGGVQLSTAADGALGAFDFDVSGGATEAIDLRSRSEILRLDVPGGDGSEMAALMSTFAELRTKHAHLLEKDPK